MGVVSNRHRRTAGGSRLFGTPVQCGFWLPKGNGKMMRSVYPARWCFILYVLCSLPSTVQADIQDRIKMLEPAHTVQSSVVGPLKILGYSIRSAAINSLNSDRIVKTGDLIEFDVYWNLIDRVDTDLRGTVRMETMGKTARIVDPTGRSTHQWHVGEVNRQTFEVEVKPSFTKEFPPSFFRYSEYPVKIGYLGQEASGFGLVDVRVGVIRVAPIVAVESGSMCLSDNLDVPSERKVHAVRRITFPDSEPGRGHGASDIYDELVDGIFLGSGNSNWESVSWGNGTRWGADRKRIVFELEKEAAIHTVVVVYNSPYPNFRIDRVAVDLSLDGVNFSEAGAYDNRSNVEERGLQFLPITDMSGSGRFVQIILSHNESATNLPVSEIYIFGKSIR